MSAKLVPDSPPAFAKSLLGYWRASESCAQAEGPLIASHYPFTALARESSEA